MPPRKSKKVKRKVKRKLKKIQHAALPMAPGKMLGSYRPPDMGWTQSVFQRPAQKLELPPEPKPILPVMDFSLAKFTVPTKMLPLTYTAGKEGGPEQQPYQNKLKSQDRIDQIRFGKMREMQHESSLPAWKSPDAVPPPEPDMSIPEGKPQSLFHNRDIHMPDVPVNEEHEMENVPDKEFKVDHQGPFSFNPTKSKWHRQAVGESKDYDSSAPSGSFNYQTTGLTEAAKPGSVAWPEAPRYKAPQEQTQVAARHFGQPEKRKAEEITLSKLERQRDHATVQIAKKSTQKTKKSRTV